MSTDYGEKERQFLASLKADTGRDLGEWMSAIAAEGLTRRNDIIDWLRRQGFMFSKASWLERIHNNGGKPIYGDGMRALRPARTRPRRSPSGPAAPIAAVAEVAPLREPSPPPADAAEAAELDHLLAKAKAFRPLAHFVLAEIRKTVPDMTVTAEAAHAMIARGGPFAVLAISPRELRLGLALAGTPFDETLQAARFTNLSPRIPPSISHMIILTDARQVNDALMTRVAEAAARNT